MRILMITPDAQVIDRRILQEGETLVRAGHHVTLLAGFECSEPGSYIERGIHIHRFQYDWDDERLKKLRNRLPSHDLLHQVVNRGFMALARRYFSTTPFDRFILEQALQHPSDVVHVHDFPVLKVGVTLAEKWNVPLVYDAHELYHAQAVLPDEVRAKYEEQERTLIRKANVVLTVNEFLAGIMAKSYGCSLPRVIYNAADIDPGRKLNSTRLRDVVPTNGPIVLFQGWLSPERNIESIVRAMPYVERETQLAIVGYGAYLDVLRSLAVDLSVDDRVHFVGKVPSEEMLDYTAGADLGIVPYLPIDDNHRYCSPNKFFEYILAGVPILTHHLAFFAMMQKRYGVLRTTDFADPQGIAVAINEAICGDGLKELRENLPRAQARLNWTIESEKLLEIYAGLQMFQE